MKEPRTEEQAPAPAGRQRQLWRRLVRTFGTMLVCANLAWLGSVGIYTGLSSGLVPWPGFEPESLDAAEMNRLFNVETSSVAVVRGPDTDPEPGGPPEGTLREPPILWATGPAATPPPAPQHPPATRIVIPSIKLDAPVVEVGVKEENGELVWETAKWAVGHHLGSANPGHPGNVVLSGHIRSPIKKEGNVFGQLPALKLGEVVVLYTEEREYRYRVMERRVVPPQEVDVMSTTVEARVTLITCYPDWIFSHRLVVSALQEPS